MNKSELTKFEGTYEEFIEKITPQYKGYLKKPRAKNTIELWWEDAERWFMNFKILTVRIAPKDSVWVIAKDLDHYLDLLYFRQGYEMFFKKDE